MYFKTVKSSTKLIKKTILIYYVTYVDIFGLQIILVPHWSGLLRRAATQAKEEKKYITI